MSTTQAYMICVGISTVELCNRAKNFIIFVTSNAKFSDIEVFEEKRPYNWAKISLKFLKNLATQRKIENVVEKMNDGSQEVRPKCTKLLAKRIVKCNLSRKFTPKIF